MTKEEPEAVYNLTLEPLPFTRVEVDDPDELLRQWIFKEIHGLDVSLSQPTIEYMESAFQWIRKGMPPKPKVVK